MLLLYAWAYLRSGNPKAAAAAAALVVPTLDTSFTLRPQLAGYCFFLLVLIGLELSRRGRTWVLALFPPLFLVWVNTHSSFILGFFVMGIYAAEGLFHFRFPWLVAERWPAGLRKRIELSALGSLLVLFLTPYGGSLAAYPIDYMLRQRLSIASQLEWASVLEIHFAPEKAFVVLVAMFVVANYIFRPICYSLRDALFLSVAIVESFLHIRMLVVFAIAFAPVAAIILNRVIPRYEPAKDKPALNVLFMAGALAACAAIFPSRARLEKFMETKCPVGNVAYLHAYPSLRPVFNGGWGGFLVHSGIKVFIYGQFDVFEYGGIFPDYLAIIEPTPDAEALLRRYSIRACLLETHSPLAEFLERRPNWRLVSSDRVSVLIEFDGHQARPETAVGK